MNIDTYRKCTNWNIGYRIDVLTPVFSIYRKPVWYSSRDVPNNNLEDVCQRLIKFTINSQFASSNSCLLSLSACHTWSHTCLDRARWSARRGRLLIHLPQAIPIPASAFNMNDCLLVTSSHGIENAQIGISVIVSMCWHRYFRYIENRYDTLAEMYQITIWKMYVSGSLNSLSTRNLHQVIPASCLWVPVTPGRTPAWTEHGDQPGVAGYSSICLRQFRFRHQLSTWTTASSSHHLMASASRPPPPPPPPPTEGLKIDAVSGRTARRLVENIIAGTYKEPVRPYRLVYIFWGRKRPGAPGPQDHHPRQRFPAVGRHRVPGGVLWNVRAGRSCPVSHTPPEDRTPQPTDARDSRDIITGQVGPKEKRADVQALRPRQAFRGRNPPEQGRLHRASLQAAEAVVTPHPPPALFRANYYIQRDIIFVVSWHWNKHWQ